MWNWIRNNFPAIFFNLWYFGSPPWDTGISPPELMSFLKEHPPGRALDLGCGSGTNSIYMARQGWQVTGIDLAYRAIGQARKKARREGVRVEWIQGDVTRIDQISGVFDLILDIGCFHGLPFDRREAYMQRLEQWLAPRGTYLLYSIWNSPGQHSFTGMREIDFTEFKSRFILDFRADGTERGLRPSTWFSFRAPDKQPPLVQENI
jgi:SAM-dependent methyltransferase